MGLRLCPALMGKFPWDFNLSWGGHEYLRDGWDSPGSEEEVRVGSVLFTGHTRT